MIEKLVLFAHLAVAALIIALVLLQRGKGAEAGSGFGAGASGTVFGARGSASFFSRATAVLATLFFATSLTLAFFSTQSSAPDSLAVDSETGSEIPGLQSGEGDGTVLDSGSDLPVVETGLPTGDNNDENP